MVLVCIYVEIPQDIRPVCGSTGSFTLQDTYKRYQGSILCLDNGSALISLSSILHHSSIKSCLFKHWLTATPKLVLLACRNIFRNREHGIFLHSSLMPSFELYIFVFSVAALQWCISLYRNLMRSLHQCKTTQRNRMTTGFRCLDLSAMSRWKKKKGPRLRRYVESWP